MRPGSILKLRVHSRTYTEGPGGVDATALVDRSMRPLRVPVGRLPGLPTPGNGPIVERDRPLPARGNSAPRANPRQWLAGGRSLANRGRCRYRRPGVSRLPLYRVGGVVPAALARRSLARSTRRGSAQAGYRISSLGVITGISCGRISAPANHDSAVDIGRTTHAIRHFGFKANSARPTLFAGVCDD
jgi:hypothetical protein